MKVNNIDGVGFLNEYIKSYSSTILKKRPCTAARQM